MEICDKKLLRREGMARRRGLTAGQRQEKSAAIAERLIHAELFRQAESVFCYISMENEVHTEAVLEAALAAGMVKPGNSQVCYIDLSEGDSAVVYQKEDPSTLTRVLTSMRGGASAIVEYLN